MASLGGQVSLTEPSLPGSSRDISSPCPAQDASCPGTGSPCSSGQRIIRALAESFWETFSSLLEGNVFLLALPFLIQPVGRSVRGIWHAGRHVPYGKRKLGKSPPR